MCAESNDNALTRNLRGPAHARPPEPVAGDPAVWSATPAPAVDVLAETGHAMSDSLLFGHTRELDPTATMRSLAPQALTPRTRRDMEIWVPEAAQLPLLSLAGSSTHGPLSSTLDLQRPGDAASDLAVTGLLGEGGSGQVLLAYQKSMGREVAVKVPRDSEPWFAPTLLAEGRLAGRIEHPNVIPIYALGRSEIGAPILVMKRMRGATWEALLRDASDAVWERFARIDGKLGHLEHHLAILLAVVQGISAAHRVGVVHRDLKPANVIVSGPDEICLIDWGLALDLHDPRGAANLVGTPAFMAPEMLGPRYVDATVGERTDVYELGAMLHYVLCGRHRNEGVTTDQILERLRGPSDVDLPDAPWALAQIVRRATAFDPKDRYPSAAAFGDAIRAWLDQRSAERIARSADERLDHLAVALADFHAVPEAGKKAARGQLDRMASACRASIEDALALAPDLPLARTTRLRYLELWVNHLLDRNDVDSARAELEAAPGLAPHLEARLTRVENDAEARMSRLRTLEQDHDLRPAASARRMLFVSSIVYTVVLSAFAFGVLPRLLPREDGQRYSPLIFAALTNTLFWSILFVWRRRLLVNAASRHVMTWVGVILLAILAHRTATFVAGGVPFARAMADEILIGAAMSAYATGGMSRRFWPAAVVTSLAYVAALVWPQFAAPLFAGAMVVVLILAARIWGRVTPD